MAEHITIGDVAPRVQYVADGVLADFTYPFPIFEEADLEIRLDGAVLAGGATIAGAGSSEGGTVSLAEPPPAGTRVTLRRRLRIARATDFQDNGILRARALNDELDYQVAAIQQVADDITGAVRLEPSDGGDLVLPLRGARANRVLGFDSVGDLTVFDRGTQALGVPYPGGVPRMVEDKLAERLTARDFGVPRLVVDHDVGGLRDARFTRNARQVRVHAVGAMPQPVGHDADDFGNHGTTGAST
jgi:hypothetical protein